MRALERLRCAFRVPLISLAFKATRRCLTRKKILLSQNFSVDFYLIFFNLSGRVTNAIYLLSQDVFIVAWC